MGINGFDIRNMQERSYQNSEVLFLGTFFFVGQRNLRNLLLVSSLLRLRYKTCFHTTDKKSSLDSLS